MRRLLFTALPLIVYCVAQYFEHHSIYSLKCTLDIVVSLFLVCYCFSWMFEDYNESRIQSQMSADLHKRRYEQKLLLKIQDELVWLHNKQDEVVRLKNRWALEDEIEREIMIRRQNAINKV